MRCALYCPRTRRTVTFAIAILLILRLGLSSVQGIIEGLIRMEVKVLTLGEMEVLVRVEPVVPDQSLKTKQKGVLHLLYLSRLGIRF